MNIKILFYNAVILLNVALWLKNDVAFGFACLVLLALVAVDHVTIKKSDSYSQEIKELRNELSLIKNQIAFKKL